MFQENIEVIKTLLEYGYSPNAQGTSNGYIPLHDAVWANNKEVIKLLLENSVDVTIKAKDGKTALEKAKSENKDAIVKMLEEASK